MIDWTEPREEKVTGSPNFSAVEVRTATGDDIPEGRFHLFRAHLASMWSADGKPIGGEMIPDNMWVLHDSETHTHFFHHTGEWDSVVSHSEEGGDSEPQADEWEDVCLFAESMIVSILDVQPYILDEIDLTDRGSVERAVAGAIRAQIHDHGTITRQWVGSTVKRVVGALKTREHNRKVENVD